MDTLFRFDNLARVMAEYATELEYAYKTKLETEDKIASGRLVSSVSSYVDMGDGTYEVVLQMEDYWKYVENGRGPGKYPPIDKILEWIEVRQIMPTPYNGKLPTEKQLAFLIARKIGEEGIEPTNLLTETIDQINEEYAVKIEEAINDDLSVAGDNVLMLLVH